MLPLIRPNVSKLTREYLRMLDRTALDASVFKSTLRADDTEDKAKKNQIPQVLYPIVLFSWCSILPIKHLAVNDPMVDRLPMPLL